MPDQRFWIGVASLDHVAAGVAGGFCMFAHGKHEAVKRVRPGDWIAYYSPRTGMREGEKVPPSRRSAAYARANPIQPSWRRGARASGATWT